MKYLNFNQLRDKLGGRARSSIYLDVEAGRLPQPVKLGGRLYWAEADVTDAMAKLEERPQDDNPCAERARKAAEVSAFVRAAKADAA